MHATYKLSRAEDVDATLTVTMKVSQWKELRGQLAEAWPSWRLGAAIRQLIDEAERTYKITAEAD